jgi:predicted dehydrogenase
MTAEAAPPAGAYPEYYRAVRDAIRQGTAPPVTPLQASSLMAVIEAGIRSSVEGRVVSPEFTDEERSAWG